MARVCKNWYLTFASLTSLSMGRLTKARCRWPFSEQISHDTIAIARDSCHLPSFPQCPTLGFGAKTPSLVANAMDGLLWYHHLAVVGRWFRTAELPMPMPSLQDEIERNHWILLHQCVAWSLWKKLLWLSRVCRRCSLLFTSLGPFWYLPTSTTSLSSLLDPTGIRFCWWLVRDGQNAACLSIGFNIRICSTFEVQVLPNHRNANMCSRNRQTILQATWMVTFR